MKLLILISIALSCMVSCTNKAVYETVQINNKNACSKEPTPDLYDRCMKSQSMTYDEYSAARGELVEVE